MNKKLIIVISAIILAIITHAYLTNHYYPLKYGMAPSESLCQMGDKMDCDVAATSKYSSFMGVPLSVFGMTFHVILLLMVISTWTGLAENKQRTLRVATTLAGFSVATSLVLAIISATKLTAWCPFCILGYIFSFIIFAVLWMLLEEPLSKVTSDITGLFTESRWLLAGVVLIPVSAAITHKAITKSFGGDRLEALVRSAVNEWKANPSVDMSSFSPALTKGPENNRVRMTLVEFADFRCGHCGQAAPSVHAFLKAHTDVRFMFYNFPLDGECNENIGSGDGVSCRLAKAVTCAGQSSSSKGFNLHDYIFKNQKDFQMTRKVSDTDKKIQEAATINNLNWKELLTCMDDPATHEAIKNQAQAGAAAKIRGTPTFFVNGKLLSRGQFIPVLKAVYEATEKD